MKKSWLGVAAVALFILAISAWATETGPGAEEEFGYERIERLRRIDFELGQVAAEQARLETERIGLARERSCTVKAKSKKQMRACSLLR